MYWLVEQVLVGPLEVERQLKACRTRGILELRAADVERERLHRRDGRRRVCSCLTTRPCLTASKSKPSPSPWRWTRASTRAAPALKASKAASRDRGNRRNLISSKFHCPLRHGQVLGPPVLDALVGDRAARIHLLDAVGPRAQADFERRLGEIARLAVGARALPEMLGQDRQLADDHRQLAVALDVEFERDLAVAGLLGLDHVLVVERDSWATPS